MGEIINLGNSLLIQQMKARVRALADMLDELERIEDEMRIIRVMMGEDDDEEA